MPDDFGVGPGKHLYQFTGRSVVFAGVAAELDGREYGHKGHSVGSKPLAESFEDPAIAESLTHDDVEIMKVVR